GARRYEGPLAEQQAEIGASRLAQVGTGERAEKIRTYNYAENRVKDHRINLLVHNLDGILAGELGEFTRAPRGPCPRARRPRAWTPRYCSRPFSGSTEWVYRDSRINGHGLGSGNRDT